MKFVVKSLLMLSFFYTTYSQAVCTRTDLPTEVVQMDMGTIVVSPNLNVGDVIKELSVQLYDKGDVFKCTTGSILAAEINTALLTTDNNKIHRTNIPGVGMKLQRTSQSGNTSATYPYSSTRQNNNSVYITPGYFVVTLYKIDTYVGSGPLTADFIHGMDHKVLGVHHLA